MDEITVYTMLDSLMAGAMTHATTVVGSAMHSDVAAVRVINGPREGINCFVDARKLRLTPSQEQTLQHWPTASDGLFEYAVDKQLVDVACRPREHMTESEYARRRLFKPVDDHASVVDAVMLSFVILDRIWAVLGLLRCNRAQPFDDRQIDALERFKPAISRMMRLAYERQMGLPGIPVQSAGPNISELLAKLSPTERQVLNYLRSDMTERQIAQAIHRSPHTVHVHVKNIYRKLHISSRKALLDLF